MNKICTSIEQSQKLIELGIDVNTADMYYSDVPVREWVDKTDVSKGTLVVFKSQIFAIENLREHKIGEGDIYAWSLSALLGVLPLEIDTHKQTDGYKIYYYVELYMKRNGKEIYLSTERHENLIDACYEMILKLHEQKLL